MMPSHKVEQYRVETIVWTGEMAEICRASGPDGQVVAIKRIRHGIHRRAAALRLLEREASIGHLFDHPNVIRVLEFVPDPEVPLMVMEFFASRNAKVRLLAPRGDPLLDYRTADVLTQMSAGLQHIHERQVIHMDIKPENFLLNDEGQVKLTDFAIAARPVEGWRRYLPRRRRIAGTRSYIAPETLLRKTPDFRTDIYSLGITFYEMLTRRAPFQGDDREDILTMRLRTSPPFMRTYDKNLTEGIDDLVCRMLERDPARRPQSMADVLMRLKRIPVYVKPPVPPTSEGPKR
jgi:eukaryotic-like serine/threonine-protein kinase